MLVNKDLLEMVVPEGKHTGMSTSMILTYALTKTTVPLN